MPTAYGSRDSKETDPGTISAWEWPQMLWGEPMRDGEGLIAVVCRLSQDWNGRRLGTMADEPAERPGSGSFPDETK